MDESGPRATGVLPAAPGTPYHLQQRTPRHRWWRTLLGFPVLAALGIALAMLAVVALNGLAELFGVALTPDGFADPLWELAVAFLTIAALLPAVLLTARWVQRRPAGTLSSVRGRLRWRWMARCAAWALLGFVGVVAIDLVRGVGWDDGAWPGWPRFACIVAVCVVAVPLQSAAEEYLCRGFLLQSFASWFRNPWPGAVLTALAFVTLHEYEDPLVLVDLFVFAMAMSWLVMRTGGLEAAIALHVVNNLANALVAAPGGVPPLDQTGDYAVWDVLPTTVLTLVYAWWIARCYRGGDRAARSGRARDSDGSAATGDRGAAGG